MDVIKIWTVVLIVASHVPSLHGFTRASRLGYIPRTVDFAIISLIIYYDLGLIFEAIGVPYSNAYFPSIFAQSERVGLLSVLLLMVAPWVLLLGTRIARTQTMVPQEPPTLLTRQSHIVFFAVALPISLYLASRGVQQVQSSGTVWGARFQTGSALGTLVVLLYLPIHFVAFYVRQRNSRTPFGTLMLVVLSSLAAASTLPLGQRTTVLVGFMIIALFRFRISATKLVIFALAGLIIASSLLTVFKWSYAEQDVTREQMLIDTINTDFARAGVLGTALGMSDPIGTSVMPFPASGYVYSALFFVPRSVAPFKGSSTASHFTSHITGIDQPSWGFGLGMIEEIALNFGYVGIFPVLLVYGVAFSLFDKLSARVPSVVVPLRFAAVWICGYHLAALILLFGGMLITLFALDRVLRPCAVAELDEFERSRPVVHTAMRSSRWHTRIGVVSARSDAPAK